MFPEDLSWTGATLYERLSYLRRHVAGLAGDAYQTLSSSDDDPVVPWAKAYAFGDLTAFFRRLSWDNIDRRLARAALTAPPPKDFPPASWVGGVSRFFAAARDCAPAVGAPAWEADVGDIGVGSAFVDVWLPVLRAARGQLTEASPDYRQWLSDESIRALERHLVGEISGRAELTLFDDFRLQVPTPSTSSEGYQSYVRHLFASRLADFLAAYPVLARHVVLLVDQWVNQTATLVARVKADRAAIESTFDSTAGQICRLTPGLSDRHAGGGRVTFVEFASGLRLAYKPRDVRIERVFNEWLAWLRHSGLAVAPRPLRVLDCGTHGWVAWVDQAEPASIEAAHAYFRSVGALICVTHVMGGTDLHSENLIASADGPVLVDTEMLLQPSTVPLSGHSNAGSCLESGLVSVIAVDSAGTPFNMGGVQPATARESAIPMRRWLNLRRDDMHFVPQRRVHPALHNDVRLNGAVQRPEDFVDDLCAGFATTYQFLLANRMALLREDGPLRGFADCSARVLFRPSDQYAATEYLLAAPRYQRRGVDRSLGLETLGRIFIPAAVRPRLWPLVHDEVQALEALDIPRFTVQASSTDLVASSGEVVHAYYSTSGMDGVRGRLSALSSDDLAYQIDQLAAAVRGCDAPPPAHGGRDQVPDQRLREAAEQIGLAVLNRAHQAADGSLQWPSCRGKTDLYAGVSGIALFLAALGAVTRRETWRNAARQALRAIDVGALDARQDDGRRRIGGCSGRPSVAYATALAGHFLEDDRLIAEGVELARTVSADAIDADVVLDINGGAAGALAALLAVHELRRDDRLLALADRCVSRLSAAQIETGPDEGAWRASDDERARAGFAHGAAGIAYALSRWTTHSADAAVREAVHRAWRFERRLFEANDGVWPTTRRDGARLVMAAWCHGAPGIALARACAPPEVADALVRDEIAAAATQTLSASDAQLDHLCCGNAGRADILLTVGLRTGTRAWIDGGLFRSEAVAARVRAHGCLGMRGKGFQYGAPAPDFFQGLAGIGYQLLRASSGGALPSVLAFEVPGSPVPSHTHADRSGHGI